MSSSELTQIKEACLGKLDELESVVWFINDVSEVGFLLKHLEAIVDTFKYL